LIVEKRVEGLNGEEKKGLKMPHRSDHLKSSLSVPNIQSIMIHIPKGIRTAYITQDSGRRRTVIPPRNPAPITVRMEPIFMT